MPWFSLASNHCIFYRGVLCDKSLLAKGIELVSFSAVFRLALHCVYRPAVFAEKYSMYNEISKHNCCGLFWNGDMISSQRSHAIYLPILPSTSVTINSLRPRQNGRLFADDTFKRIFLNENIRISTENSLKFVPNRLISNIPALVLIMAWRRPGD